MTQDPRDEPASRLFEPVYDDLRALAARRMAEERDALGRLAREDERAARVARLRLLVGFSTIDVSAAIGFAPRTVRRDWAYARAWPARFLDPEFRGGG